MDRPELVVTANGKEARYGRRHLLQFVAAKRLQAEGSSLPEIRERLAHVGDVELARLAAIPAGVVPPELVDVAAPTRPAARAPFWRHGPDAPGAPSAAAAMPPALPPAASAPPGDAGPGAFRVAVMAAPADLPTRGAAARSVGAAGAAAPATFSRSVGPSRTVTVVALGPGIEVQFDTAIHPPGQVAQLAAALANAVSATLPISREEP